jgi:predicted nucleotidyltransferase
MNLPDHLTPNEQKAIEEAVKALAHEHTSLVRFVALFGSKARGDFHEESDIDLLIIIESDDWKTRDQIRDPIFGINFAHGIYISPRVMSWERIQEISLRRGGLFANLRRDAIELWRRPGTENPLAPRVPEPALPVA